MRLDKELWYGGSFVVESSLELVKPFLQVVDLLGFSLWGHVVVIYDFSSSFGSKQSLAL